MGLAHDVVAGSERGNESFDSRIIDEHLKWHDRGVGLLGPRLTGQARVGHDNVDVVGELRNGTVNHGDIQLGFFDQFLELVSAHQAGSDSGLTRKRDEFYFAGWYFWHGSVIPSMVSG